jgi:hypothetical protein
MGDFIPHTPSLIQKLNSKTYQKVTSKVFEFSLHVLSQAHHFQLLFFAILDVHD